MKKQIAFLGAAAAALTMAGVAHADGGYVGLSYNDNNDAGVNSWTIDGAFAAQNFQFDAGYTNINDLNANEWNVGAHLFSRNDQWLWGGFVGYDAVSGSGSDLNEWTVALQTQFYMPRTTISGNLSYSSINNVPFAGDVRTTQIDGEARFFATDNFSFQGNLGWGNLDADAGSGNFWTYGVGAEWQARLLPDQHPCGLAGLRSGFELQHERLDHRHSLQLGRHLARAQPLGRRPEHAARLPRRDLLKHPARVQT